jgi:hypothetical protein
VAPATPTPAQSIVPATAAPTAGGAGPDVGGAAAALSDLDSYHLRTVMKMQGLEESLFSAFGDGLEMEGTIIFRPTRAADITMSMAVEGQKTDLGYRVIGDQAWISLGGSWMETPAEDAASVIDSLAADKMLGSFSGVSGLAPVGEETRNGVATVHYAASGASLSGILGSSTGLPNATWTVAFWVAKDAGYAVGYAVVGKSADGSFEMTLDITDINSPANKVEPPPAG